jgi:hypothetical protein
MNPFKLSRLVASTISLLIVTAVGALMARLTAHASDYPAARLAITVDFRDLNLSTTHLPIGRVGVPVPPGAARVTFARYNFGVETDVAICYLEIGTRRCSVARRRAACSQSWDACAFRLGISPVT